MHTFAEKQKSIEPTQSANPLRSGSTLSGQYCDPILNLQRTVGNQAVQRLLKPKPENLNTDESNVNSIRGQRLLAGYLSHVAQQGHSWRLGKQSPVLMRSPIRVSRTPCQTESRSRRLADRHSPENLFWQHKKYNSREISDRRRIRIGGRVATQAEIANGVRCWANLRVWEGEEVSLIRFLSSNWNVQHDETVLQILEYRHRLATSADQLPNLLRLLGESGVWRGEARRGSEVVAVHLLWLLGRMSNGAGFAYLDRNYEATIATVERHFSRSIRRDFQRMANSHLQQLSLIRVDPRRYPVLFAPRTPIPPAAAEALVEASEHAGRISSEFVAGFRQGLDVSADTQRRIAQRMRQMAALNVAFPLVFTSGLLVGAVEDAADTIRAIAGFLASPREALRRLRLTVARLLHDPEAARDFGRAAGQATSGQINSLSEEGVFEFTYDVGRLVAPFVAEIILAILTGGVATVARGALRGASRVIDVLEDVFGDLRHLPDRRSPDISDVTSGRGSDINVPGTRAPLRRASLPDEWRRVLDDNDVNLLNRTQNIDSPDLPDDLANDEFLLARRGPSEVIDQDGYVERIELPNGHRWQRRVNRDGSMTWCRFTQRRCFLNLDRPRPGETGAEYERRIFEGNPLPRRTRDYWPFRAGSFRAWYRALPQYARQRFEGGMVAADARAARIMGQSNGEFIDEFGSPSLRHQWARHRQIWEDLGERVNNLRQQQRGFPTPSTEFRDLQRRIDALEEDIQEITRFEIGPVGNRRPDQIDLYPQRQRADVVDITLRPHDPWHNLKTLFYRDVIRAVTGWPDVEGIDFMMSTVQVVVQ